MALTIARVAVGAFALPCFLIFCILMIVPTALMVGAWSALAMLLKAMPASKSVPTLGRQDMRISDMGAEHVSESAEAMPGKSHSALAEAVPVPTTETFDKPAPTSDCPTSDSSSTSSLATALVPFTPLTSLDRQACSLAMSVTDEDTKETTTYVGTLGLDLIEQAAECIALCDNETVIASHWRRQIEIGIDLRKQFAAAGGMEICAKITECVKGWTALANAAEIRSQFYSLRATGFINAAAGGATQSVLRLRPC
ncbi:hypothetical protein CHLRE_05g237850v5 [Chlamydomonas reinhardtii]|uniref:Uncharacterized protein n=1 Tax=Chlamydomonas reinhardtii TaxID=3055 RepID=A8J8A3_CHLRE|nr:uncharacterized protein CHLRE_05g237850v5 [Chlamydomonas reinhardtii]PNW83639.1 hypothetical protein CHLRE_05g237850v5 [Chlamydomonas reinhardtii]|eukprot:XP_001697729.1 predicted protein [Chlamydomonas reinhardtii]